jgi:hypothetical protein
MMRVEGLDDRHDRSVFRGVGGPGAVKLTGTVAAEIGDVEGFDVRFVNDAGDAMRRRAGDHPHARAASGTWTVARWREARFWTTYPDFDVDVLRPDGSVADDEHRACRPACCVGLTSPTRSSHRSRASRLPQSHRPSRGSGNRHGSPRRVARADPLDAADKTRGNLEAGRGGA